MIEDIRAAAEAVGITAVITNSDAKIETQLNRITRHEQLPIMLISWDIVTTLAFNDFGSLKHPSVAITCLLMDKAESNEKELKEAVALKMGVLFTEFVQELYNVIISFQHENETPPISGAQYTLVPSHGAGKHSGILGSFTMKARVQRCKDIILPATTPDKPIRRGIGRDRIGKDYIGSSPECGHGIGKDIIGRVKIK